MIRIILSLSWKLARLLLPPLLVACAVISARGIHFVCTADIAPIAHLVRPPVIEDSEGREFARLRHHQWQTLDRIPPILIEALIQREDAGFREHGGVSVKALLRGGVGLIGIKGFNGGGSTLTMQLAKLLHDGKFAATGNSRLPGTNGRIPVFSPLERKTSQILAALWLERHLTKNEILELYFNVAHFAHGHRGAAAASQGVFGVPLAETTTPEQLLLLAFVQLPSRSLHSEGGIVGRKHHQSWVELVNRIAQIYYQNDRANAWSLPANYQFRKRNPKAAAKQASPASDGSHWVIAQVRAEFAGAGISLGNLPSLRISTSIDSVLQGAAVSALRQLPAGVEAAVVAVDADGIKALVGGRSTIGSCRATAMRSRGLHSTIKPFMYAAAFETGQFTPESTVATTPLFHMSDGSPWPSDHCSSVSRQVTIAEAFRRSHNTVPVHLYVSRPQVAARFHSIFDATGGLPPRSGQPADLIGNGPSGMNLVQHAAGFLAFINDGMLSFPRIIQTVTSEDGRILFQSRSEPHRIVSPITAGQIENLLLETVTEPDGTARSLNGILDEPVGAKTGSHLHDQRVAIVLPARGLSISVWVGCDTPKPLSQDGMALRVGASMLRALSR